MSCPERLLDGPAAWDGRDLSRTFSWIRTLTEDELGMLRAALDRVRNRSFLDITGDDLPALPLFDEIRSDLLQGRGFTLLRGIDVAGLPMEDAARLFWLIGTRFGRALPQNAKGHVLGHVKDLGLRADDPRVRIYQTSERQGFHTDSCDVVGLMCLSTARRGGLSSLASTWTAYNEVFR